MNQTFRVIFYWAAGSSQTNDVVIASYCIDKKIPLLFSDKDFKPFVEALNLIPAIA